jgi:HAD superfamily hydrolase (TIGR01490 family)
MGYLGTVCRPIAFFDLDLTLLEVNSASLWVRREVRLGHLSRWWALRAAGWLGLYELGFGRMEDAIRGAARTLTGKEEAVLHQRTIDFWNEELETRIRPGGRAAVAAHQAKGELAVLLTSSSNYLGQLAVDALGMDGLLSNQFEVIDGQYTGDLKEPLCFGAGKLHHGAAMVEASGVDLSRCTFYTDSMSDLPVLEAVGRPVAVHPDPRLRREASRRGWEIADWQQA